MIGKSEWFRRRKYGGWGIHPKNWKGWTYIGSFIFILLAFQLIPFWSDFTRTLFTGFWALVLVIDVVDIMVKMKKDERDKQHEAIAERNAMWIVSIVLSIGLAYQIILSSIKQEILIDWWLVVALVAGLLAKSVTNYYLDRKN